MEPLDSYILRTERDDPKSRLGAVESCEPQSEAIAKKSCICRHFRSSANL